MPSISLQLIVASMKNSEMSSSSTHLAGGEIASVGAIVLSTHITRRLELVSKDIGDPVEDLLERQPFLRLSRLDNGSRPIGVGRWYSCWDSSGWSSIVSTWSKANDISAVSYTHLTLPTKRIV